MDTHEIETQAFLPLGGGLGGEQWNGWTGLTPCADAPGWAVLGDTGEAEYRYPTGPRGWYKHGLRDLNDSAADWSKCGGLHLEIELDEDGPVTLDAVLTSAHSETSTASVQLYGRGRHTPALPWPVFDFEQARSFFLSAIQAVRLRITEADGSPAPRIRIGRVRVVPDAGLSLTCPVLGRAAERGGDAVYEVRVGNGTDKTQAVTLLFERYGWEAMTAAAVPSSLVLRPGESREVMVRVRVSERVPPGGHETQRLRATPNGDGTRASTLEFFTASALPHPYLLHTPERWQEVRTKSRDYPWAQAARDKYVERAAAWQVPEIAQPPDNDPDDTMGPFLFHTHHEHDLMACGISWQMTGNRSGAEKIALFLRRLSDPERGYPRTLRGCHQGLVQEGHFFQHLAMAYDMAFTANVFSAKDKEHIEKTFRLFLETVDQANRGGGVSNWNISEVVGGFYCALALQDLAAAERFFSGPGGICDQLAKGTMDDGWWYECSLSYNLWCACEFSQVALAWEPWGVNFRDRRLPASYAQEAMLSAPGAGTDDAEQYALRRPFGMSREIWGPRRRPFREIRDLWNGLLPFVDYRGVLFGVNDSTEKSASEERIGGTGSHPYEIAYYVYRDPAYAALVKLAGDRDLLYGVPELPETTPELFRQSAYADNVGLAMLRSQAAGRPMREQIQAALHYGTHGWAHGHFDRTGLLSLMRYGRSFYNPEAVFYIYEPFLYKFYCQTSVSQNMVTVDQKMQEAADSQRLLFYSGTAMQAAAVQTDTRWSDPPYGGMVYDYVPVKTFEEKCWREGRFVPIPEDAPEYGSLNRFTERILQRRVLVVTDDYILLADYLRGSEPHTFDSLLQIKGFQGLDAAAKTFVRHDDQWNPDPVGSAQFVTDCDWYDVEAPAVARFETCWGPGADNAGTYAPYSEDGPLTLDVHALWPPAPQVMIGTAPEPHDEQKRLFYAVRGDGDVLAEGKFGAWILGKAAIDVSVEGVTHLQLETRVELSQKPTVFWAGAGVVLRDGREVPLADLPLTCDNLVQPPAPGLDYFGGPVKIAGRQYAQSTPGQPESPDKPARIEVDLTGVDAVRFHADLGGDYPLGDEIPRRKTFAVRSEGTEARFLTLIEPYESRPVVVSAEALSADALRVTLTSGHVQDIEISGLEGDGHTIRVTLTESWKGTVIRRETTGD